MNKLSFGFGAALTLLFSMMAFSLFIGPVLANSSTATVIGGATNGNIFGSIQFDELNVTDTGVWRFDTAGGPVIATFTYGAVTPTIVYNASIQNNFNGGSVVNVGAAGNDFGATNTLVATTFSGNVNVGSNNLQWSTNLQLFERVAHQLQLSPQAGNNIGFFEIAPSGTQQNTRFTMYNTSFTGAEKRHQFVVDVDSTRINMQITGAGGGFDVPFNILHGGITMMTFSGTNQIDLNSISTVNVGAAGNDFGATNALVASIFSGDISAAVVKNPNDNFNIYKSQSDSLLLQTNSGAGAAITRIQIFDGAAISRIQIAAGGVLNVGTATHATPTAGDLRMSGTNLLFYNGTGWRTVTSTP